MALYHVETPLNTYNNQRVSIVISILISLDNHCDLPASYVQIHNYSGVKFPVKIFPSSSSNKVKPDPSPSHFRFGALTRAIEVENYGTQTEGMTPLLIFFSITVSCANI